VTQKCMNWEHITNVRTLIGRATCEETARIVMPRPYLEEVAAR